jgi:endonuclease/exonuclease/phosphatase family metal-dependent hydrolase
MKIVTLNLRHDADRWPERFPLIVEELLAEDPDVIAFQEVALPIRQADLIASAMNLRGVQRPYEVYLASKWGREQNKEGCAFLSRLAVRENTLLNLPQHNRIAQIIELSDFGRPIRIVNTHLHHMPFNDESIRLEQVRYLLSWMFQEQYQGDPWILLGDFNAVPESETIVEVRKHLASAYRKAHDHEPEYTFPTPLVTAEGRWTLDYIFFDSAAFEVRDARVVFAQSHGDDASLYASDHYGLVASLELIGT